MPERAGCCKRRNGWQYLPGAAAGPIGPGNGDILLFLPSAGAEKAECPLFRLHLAFASILGSGWLG